MYLDGQIREAELAFLNAPFDPDGWAVAMGKLAEVTGTRLAQLIGVGRPLGLPLNFLTDQPHDPRGHISNPLLYGPENWRINATERPMRLEHEPHYEAYRERRCTAMYDDAVSDLDLPFGCQTALLLEPECIVGISLLRSSREGRCSADVLQTFARVTRQAQRALRVHLALGEELAETMLRAVEGRGEATLLLDRYGNLCAMTDAAEALFDYPHGLRLNGHAVCLANQDEDTAFAAAIGRLLTSDGLTGPVLHQARMGRCAERPEGRWRLFIVRLRVEDHCLGFDPHLAVSVKPLG